MEAGIAVTIDGSWDHLVNIQGLPDYIALEVIKEKNHQ